VIVASLLAGESRHHEALDIWRTVLEGESRAVMPWTVLVEKMMNKVGLLNAEKTK
jgi:hypothetical protein